MTPTEQRLREALADPGVKPAKWSDDRWKLYRMGFDDAKRAVLATLAAQPEPAGEAKPVPEALRARFEAWTKTAPAFAPEFEAHKAWAEQFAWFAVRDIYTAAPQPAAAPAVGQWQPSDEYPPWLLPREVAERIGNEHRVRAGAVQAIAKAVHELRTRLAPTKDERAAYDAWFVETFGGSFVDLSPWAMGLRAWVARGAVSSPSAPQQEAAVPAVRDAQGAKP